jgi:transcriptional regulator with XRE-family HTH domain
MSNDRAVIAVRLKEAREYLGLSQQEVSDALGLPRSAVSLIETGQRRVDAIELTAMAKLYQRSVAYLTGEDEQVFSADVNLLARQAAQLSEQDRSELMRFTEFLMQRSQTSTEDDNKA